MAGQYRICTRCVMDSTASDIVFDENGVCNYCREFLARASEVIRRDPRERDIDLARLAERVRAGGRGKRYDCIVGVSGGVDSSWALVQVVKLGLRPLAVHMDNGWNTELAQSNIANLVRRLDVDLYTHVIDWEEYRRLMQAFFAADVIDVELLYDNAMLAVNYRQAARQGLRYILAGTNQATEGMRIPSDWNWFKYDKRNIEALGRRFGGVRLETFPALGTLGYLWYTFARRISWVSVLDLTEYRRAEAMATLQREFDYKPYPYKHYESLFTRFYQGYLLPAKFGVDKRRLHLGTLVASGQLGRDEALRALEAIAYPSPEALEEDKHYFVKKMAWSPEQLGEYIKRPGKPHADYPSERALFEFLSRAYRLLCKPRKR